MFFRLVVAVWAWCVEFSDECVGSLFYNGHPICNGCDVFYVNFQLSAYWDPSLRIAMPYKHPFHFCELRESRSHITETKAFPVGEISASILSRCFGCSVSKSNRSFCSCFPYKWHTPSPLYAETCLENLRTFLALSLCLS